MLHGGAEKDSPAVDQGFLMGTDTHRGPTLEQGNTARKERERRAVMD